MSWSGQGRGLHVLREAWQQSDWGLLGCRPTPWEPHARRMCRRRTPSSITRTSSEFGGRCVVPCVVLLLPGGPEWAQGGAPPCGQRSATNHRWPSCSARQRAGASSTSLRTVPAAWRLGSCQSVARRFAREGPTERAVLRCALLPAGA